MRSLKMLFLVILLSFSACGLYIVQSQFRLDLRLNSVAAPVLNSGDKAFDGVELVGSTFRDGESRKKVTTTLSRAGFDLVPEEAGALGYWLRQVRDSDEIYIREASKLTDCGQQIIAVYLSYADNDNLSSAFGIYMDGGGCM